MRRFPTAAHLVSWAGLCPRNDESAGKRRSTRLRKGAPWLKTALVQCAWAASRRRALAEDRPGAVRLGGQPDEGRLSPGAVPAAAAAPRPQEGRLRRRRLLHARRHLAHAARRHLLARPRARPLPQALARAAGGASRPPDRQARVRLLHHAPSTASFCLVVRIGGSPTGAFSPSQGLDPELLPHPAE